MRDMDQLRIKKYKCLYCGCRNKRLYILGVGKHEIGYMWTCCNCGHKDTFIEDVRYIQYYNAGKTTILDSICVNPEKCTKKDCPLYKDESSEDNNNSNTSSGNTSESDRKENMIKPIIKEIKKENKFL